MNWKRVILLLSTARYLRAGQVFHYIYYNILKYIGVYTKLTMTSGHDVVVRPITPVVLLDGTKFNPINNGFTLLNKTHEFNDKIDWNCSIYGKLWVYHLNYFEFIHAKNSETHESLRLLTSYCKDLTNAKYGLEPYCLSLRIIQWIKFLSLHSIDNRYINDRLWDQGILLERRIEFHLSANHVLENAMALVALSAYFSNGNRFKGSTNLLFAELAKQVMTDGCHYERSPMYQLMLTNRLLDVINICQHYTLPDRTDEVLTGARMYAGQMLGWLKKMRVGDQLPAFNDSVNNYALSLEEVFGYAHRLNIYPNDISLGVSSFRRYENNAMALILDFGTPNPSYQPGHYHAGIFSFVLFHNRTPLIVDTGISTYENNSIRQYERGTAAHNTVTVNGANQSEVWSAFRVGRRARVYTQSDDLKWFKCWHDGYERLGRRHHFELRVTGGEIEIFHDLEPIRESTTESILRLHFHPNVEVSVYGDSLVLNSSVRVSIDADCAFALEDYDFAEDFNVIKPAKVLKIIVDRFCRIGLRNMK